MRGNKQVDEKGLPLTVFANRLYFLKTKIRFCQDS